MALTTLEQGGREKRGFEADGARAVFPHDLGLLLLFLLVLLLGFFAVEDALHEKLLDERREDGLSHEFVGEDDVPRADVEACDLGENEDDVLADALPCPAVVTLTVRLHFREEDVVRAVRRSLDGELPCELIDEDGGQEVHFFLDAACDAVIELPLPGLIHLLSFFLSGYFYTCPCKKRGRKRGVHEEGMENREGFVFGDEIDGKNGSIDKYLG